MTIDTKFNLLIIGFLSIIIFGIIYMFLDTPTTNTSFCPSCNPNFAGMLFVVGVIGLICNIILKYNKEEKNNGTKN